MAAGVPMVAYDCPTGPADVLGDGRAATILLIDKGTDRDLV